MLTNVAVGTLMVVSTSVIHLACMVLSLALLRRRLRSVAGFSLAARLVVVSGTIVLFFAATLAEVSVWAMTYSLVGAIDGREPSLYFSMVTFTTLGYGDMVLEEPWRLLGSFEAANGIIMFGWTTAVVMAVVQRVYSPVLEGGGRDESS